MIQCYYRRKPKLTLFILSISSKLFKYFSFRFKQSVALVQHQRIHSGERPHSCTYCGKSFIQVSHLINHERTHTGETPFVCQICHHKFKQASGLFAHAKTHENVKKFECEFCPKSFVSEKGLLNHEAVHSYEKRHKCSECSKAFARETNLISHMRTHEKANTAEPKPIYTCGICKKFFETEVLLLAHKALCLTEKPFRFVAYDDMFSESNDIDNITETSNDCTAEIVVTIESSGDINNVEISALVKDREQTIDEGIGE